MIVLFLVIIQKKISANINTQALGVKEEEEEKGGERERERGNYGSKNSEWVWDAESERRVVYMLCSCCTRLR